MSKDDEVETFWGALSIRYVSVVHRHLKKYEEIP